jgi:hypothetical protein
LRLLLAVGIYYSDCVIYPSHPEQQEKSKIHGTRFRDDSARCYY